MTSFSRDSRPAPDPTIEPGGEASLVRSKTPMADPLPTASDTRQAKPESSLSAVDTRYLAQIRGAMARFGRRSEPGESEVDSALADLADAATIDVEAPSASNRRAGRAAKQGIKKLTRWYLRYIAQQTTVLGQAATRLGAALAERTDRLEDTTSGLSDELARLRDRVERLERREAETAEPPGPPPKPASPGAEVDRRA